MEYKGHTIVTYREDNYYNNKPAMPHEFFVNVDGEKIASATQLEKGFGIEYEDIPNWKWALEFYGKAYIDGLED